MLKHQTAIHRKSHQGDQRIVGNITHPIALSNNWGAVQARIIEQKQLAERTGLTERTIRELYTKKVNEYCGFRYCAKFEIHGTPEV